MLPEYAVVMTLEAYIFIFLAAGLQAITAADVLVPIWVVLPLACAGSAVVVASVALYALTWGVQTWLQEPSWAWFMQLKLMIFDQNIDLSVTTSAIAGAAHSAYVVYVGVWLALLLNVLAIWFGDEGHIDGLWHMLFRQDLALSTPLNTMKLNVMLALILLGVIALMLLPVATFLKKSVEKKEDAKEQILESRQNGLIYTVVVTSLLIQYTIYLQPLNKLMTYEQKFLLFALLPLFADVVADGVLARRLTMNLLCETFSYSQALALLVLSCTAPVGALVLVFFEQHMFVYSQFFLLNVCTLCLLLASRALDCHLAITIARKKTFSEDQEQQKPASARWGRGTKQPKFFFRRGEKKHKKES